MGFSTFWPFFALYEVSKGFMIANLGQKVGHFEVGITEGPLKGQPSMQDDEGS